MKNMLHVRILCILVLSLLFPDVGGGQEKPAAAVSAPYAGATIADFHGKIGIQLPGQALISPSRGEILPPESIISTDDGRLLLRLADGSDILVRPHTKLVLKQPEATAWRYLQLVLGRIHSQIQHHLGGTPSFQMGTPSAVISVRGTVFDVEVDHRGDTQIDVEEGVVELGSAEGRGESVMVTAGFSSRIGMSSGPEVPRPTHDLRPQLDRHHNRESGTDEALKRLETSARDSHDSRDGNSGSSGSDDGRQSGSDLSSGSSSDSGSQQSGSGSDDSSDQHRSGGSKPPGRSGQ